MKHGSMRIRQTECVSNHGDHRSRLFLSVCIRVSSVAQFILPNRRHFCQPGMGSLSMKVCRLLRRFTKWQDIMASDAPYSPPEPGRNLPPVTPPSGRFIAQLFLVPGLIVFFIVLLLVALNYMIVGGQSPDQHLKDIDSKNSAI